MSLSEHLAILPILLPLGVGALMLLLDESQRPLKVALNLGSTLALLVIAGSLCLRAADAEIVYRLGAWPLPFGIALVVDRLAAAMLLTTAVLALAALLFSLARWHRVGVHFHPLFQFLLMGLDGAFLTGDLFNLFVFFEVLLVASYGLVLHGSGRRRVQAGYHYIVVNLAASLVFLLGVALVYGSSGTLNMAELALRVPQLAGAERGLLEAGAALLGVAFLVKAAAWPLGFWLQPAYALAAAPAAALFAILSKVGVYAIVRLWLLALGASFGADWLLAAGLATLIFGTLGVLGAQGAGRLAGSLVLVSSGTLIAFIALGDARIIGAALYYLVSSTFGLGAFFLLVELIERDRSAAADILAVTREAFGDDGAEENEVETEIGVAIPGAMALLGLAFLACALLLIGLPPLSGFTGKFLLLDGLFAARGGSVLSWLLLGVLLASSFAALLALTRTGLHRFWAPLRPVVPRVRVLEMLPVALLLTASMVLTVQADAAFGYLRAGAAALLGAAAVPGAGP